MEHSTANKHQQSTIRRGTNSCKSNGDEMIKFHDALSLVHQAFVHKLISVVTTQGDSITVESLQALHTKRAGDVF